MLHIMIIVTTLKNYLQPLGKMVICIFSDLLIGCLLAVSLSINLVLALNLPFTIHQARWIAYYLIAVWVGSLTKITIYNLYFLGFAPNGYEVQVFTPKLNQNDP